jgi:hypothetical protein
VSLLGLLRRAEFTLAILLSLMLVFLLIVRIEHAGPLWRDECAVVQLARMQSVTDIARNFQHEAFPPLFPLIIRAYTALSGSSDTALRLFGFCVGCAVIVAYWITARLLHNGIPLLALALLSLNTTFLVWGTTIRGYGLGCALVVLMFGCVGSLLLVASPKRAASALVVSVAAVQVLLYNTILLIAIAGSATLILLFRRWLNRALVAVAICVVAILSLLPFIPEYLRARDWNILVRGAPTWYSLWKHFEVALGNPGYSMPAVWYSVAIGLAGVCIFRIYKNPIAAALPERRLIWFATLVCGLSLVGCYAFLRILSYTTSVWYYLACIAVIAAALDLIGSRVCTLPWLRCIRLGFALWALIAAPFADWSAITERQTNVDVAARTVAAEAGHGDLVLVAPWPFGITFQRYYGGAAPWMTIPNIADHQVHRYDLMKLKMLSPRPVDDLVDAIRATLSSGNRVWFVGGLNLPPPEEGPMLLPPAPASRFKWDNRAYTAAWWQQLSVFAVTHANSIDSIPLPLPPSVRINELEQTSLTVAQGWH